MKKYIIFGILLLLVIGSYFGYNFLYPNPVIQQNSTVSEKFFTLKQIAEHNNAQSCWTAIEGNVYDLSPFVKSGFHPGKETILQGCGVDASLLFNTRPMGSGTRHSERAREMLPKYKIGELAK